MSIPTDNNGYSYEEDYIECMSGDHIKEVAVEMVVDIN